MLEGIIHSPFTWIFFSAVFVGLALSRATRVISVKNDRTVSKKWSLVIIFFSAAICFFMIGIFIPGAEKIQDIRLLYLFSGVAVIAFVMARFRKAVGLPLVFFILCIVVVISLFVRSITAFTGETEIALVRVLRAYDVSMKIEVDLPEEAPLFYTLEGEYLAPVVRVIIFDDYIVFLGTKTWYRFEGITSFVQEKTENGVVFRQTDSYAILPKPIGLSESLYNLFEKYEKQIPGVKSVQIEIDLKRVNETNQARELETYSIRVQNDGGVQIVRVNRS